MGLFERFRTGTGRVPIHAPDLALYQFTTCPYCFVVRRALRRLGVEVALRDVSGVSTHRQALRAGGGIDQVPCLLIRGADGSERWMYESRDIVRYLNRRFAGGRDHEQSPVPNI